MPLMDGIEETRILKQTMPRADQTSKLRLRRPTFDGSPTLSKFRANGLFFVL